MCYKEGLAGPHTVPYLASYVHEGQAGQDQAGTVLGMADTAQGMSREQKLDDMTTHIDNYLVDSSETEPGTLAWVEWPVERSLEGTGYPPRAQRGNPVGGKRMRIAIRCS